MTSIPQPLSDCAFCDADRKESFKRPRSVYEDISDANSTLSNHDKWFIMSNGSSQYNPDNKYIISPSTFQLGQIFELREIIPMFFENPRQSPSSVDNHLYSAITPKRDTSVGGQGLTAQAVEDSRNASAFRSSQVNKIFKEIQSITESLERLCKDGYICTNIDPIEEADAEEQCKRHWWALPLLPKQESYHFHVTPYPQRNYMSLSKFTVALAFILEGYDYEIEEGAFRLLTKRIEPSKQTVYYYQWHRTSLDDRFEEPIIPQLPAQVSAKTNPVQGSLTRYKREEWWECDDR